MAYDAIRTGFVGCFDGEDFHNLGLKVSKLNKAVDIAKDKEHENKDKALEQMERFRMKPESAEAYKVAFERLKRVVDSRKDEDCVIFEIKSTTRVLLGTGNASVFEFGFNLNHPWGVPYISGATLKGAVSSYLARKGGEDWKRFNAAVKSKDQVELFGGNMEGDSQSYSGMLIFHDAWLCPWDTRHDRGDWFDKEIITPHYSSYYKDGGAPTGMDDPKPIHVAALCPGLKFQVVIQGPKEYCALAKKVLIELLEVEGIGGKTAVGYGRFEYIEPPAPPKSAEETFKEWFIAQKFSAANKGKHGEIIERLKKIEGPGLSDAVKLVVSSLKKNQRSPKLHVYLQSICL